MKLILRLARALLFIMSVGVALFSMRYWNFDVIDFLQMKSTEVLANDIYRIAFYGHVIFGPVALITGPFQFIRKWRIVNLDFHRTLGKIYISACLISGLSGIAAAFWTLGGTATKMGFGFLGLSWLITTTKAYIEIKKGNVSGHEDWMIRSFALTLSAVTLRIYLLILEKSLGLTFIEAYSVVAWLCWIPNLIIAELYIRTVIKLKMKNATSL